MSTVGYKPEGNTVYNYSITTLTASDYTCSAAACSGGKANSGTPTLTGTKSATAFIIAASGQIDSDTFIDGWTINNINALNNGATSTVSFVNDTASDVLH